MMKKSESLVTTLAAVYAYILLICIFLYWLFKYLQLDIGLSTNLLIWSATIFAPLVILFTYKEWRKQKATEVIANIAKDLTYVLDEYFFEIKAIIQKLNNNLMIDQSKFNASNSPLIIDESEIQKKFLKTIIVRKRINEYFALINFENNDKELLNTKIEFDEAMHYLKEFCMSNCKKYTEEDGDKLIGKIDRFLVEIYKWALYRKEVNF